MNDNTNQIRRRTKTVSITSHLKNEPGVVHSHRISFCAQRYLPVATEWSRHL